MSWIAVGTAAVGLVGGALGSSASKKAAKQQEALSRDALTLQANQIYKMQADQEPYMQSGREANSTLAALLGQGGEFSKDLNVEMDPGFAFGQQEGEKALMRQLSARGLRMAPASMQALLRYNQDYTGTKYNEAFQRALANRQSRFGMLSDLANRGQASASNSAQAGQAGAASMSGLLTGIGNAQASGTMGSANAWGGAINTAGNAFMQQQMLNQYLKGQNQGGGYNPLNDPTAKI